MLFEYKKIKAEFNSEIGQLLKNMLGLIPFEKRTALILVSIRSTRATRVLIFDHIIRRTPTDIRDEAIKLRGPGKRVHIDQSYNASEDRVKNHLSNEADGLLKKCFQIINLNSLHIPLQ